MQTKLGSFVESWANIAIGFLVSYAANIWILPLMLHTKISYNSAFWVGVVYTVISLIRSYLLRRLFNRIKFGNYNAP